jgi:glycosyltransferase involved in cell wall biosynthesis
MRVAFDSQIFTMQEYGGISRYICSLAVQLNNTADIEAKIFAPFYINAYLDNLKSSMVYGVRIPRIPKTGTIFHLGGLWLARGVISRFSPHIVHETYYSAHSVGSKPARTVITVYDMIHERFSSLFSQNDQTSKLKRESVLRADHVICISENTRRDLLDLVPISPDRVSVVYLGFDQLSFIDKNLSVALPSTKLPYLLFVGGRSHYKNFTGLLRAYASSTWLINNFRIICVGGGRLQIAELELMKELGIPIELIEQNNADDNMLAALYRNAAAFVYPSMYEGFGIPPLEAMSLECPVICSNTSSIPEVVGDAGEYFEPDNVESIRVAIERVLQETGRREELVQKGIERCALFSWERCAAETLEIYRSLV